MDGQMPFSRTVTKDLNSFRASPLSAHSVLAKSTNNLARERDSPTSVQHSDLSPSAIVRTGEEIREAKLRKARAYRERIIENPRQFNSCSGVQIMSKVTTYTEKSDTVSSLGSPSPLMECLSSREITSHEINSRATSVLEKRDSIQSSGCPSPLIESMRRSSTLTDIGLEEDRPDLIRTPVNGQVSPRPVVSRKVGFTLATWTTIEREEEVDRKALDSFKKHLPKISPGVVYRSVDKLERSGSAYSDLSLPPILEGEEEEIEDS